MEHKQQFGKYHHIGEFLDHYKKQQNSERVQQIQTEHKGNIQAQIDSLKKPVPDVVEVEATIAKTFGDEHEHYQFNVHITQLITASDNSSINDDVNNCIKDSLDVFLAVRYGDKDGLSQAIDGDINVGDKLHLKGQWIPAAKAYASNGEKISVLHYTHHPVGFICTVEKCYS